MALLEHLNKPQISNDDRLRDEQNRDEQNHERLLREAARNIPQNKIRQFLDRLRKTGVYDPESLTSSKLTTAEYWKEQSPLLSQGFDSLKEGTEFKKATGDDQTIFIDTKTDYLKIIGDTFTQVLVTDTATSKMILDTPGGLPTIQFDRQFLDKILKTALEESKEQIRKVWITKGAGTNSKLPYLTMAQLRSNP